MPNFEKSENKPEENGQNTQNHDVNGSSSKTFTQDEVNSIVGKRVAEERAKFGDYDELKKRAAEFDKLKSGNETELEKTVKKLNDLQKKIDGMEREKTVSAIRQKVADEKKVPVSLLYGTTEEDCNKQADLILDFSKKSTYPELKDGGETSPTPSGKTRDQFAAWFDKAINSN